MRVKSFLVAVLIGFFQLASAQVAAPFAQPPPARFQESIIFLDGGGSNRVYVNPGEGALAHLRNHRINRWIPAPLSVGQALNPAVGGAFLWCPVIEGAPEAGRVGLFRYSLESLAADWERVASIDVAHGVPSLLIPLEDDYFLGLSNGLGFSDDRGSACSFAARFRLREQRLDYDACVALPLPADASAFKSVEHVYPGPERKPASIRACEPSHATLRPCLWPPSMSRDYLALAAPATDLVWIFDLAQGRVRATLSLLGLSASDRDRLSPLQDVILGTAFAPDGKLLLATRHPEWVERARAMGKDTLLTEAQKSIQWWAWEPGWPSAKKLDASVLFPDHAPTLQRQERLRFLLNAHGGVHTNATENWRHVLRAVGVPEDTPSAP